MDGFNLEKFEAEGFKARESAVPVPELSAFFDDGAEAVWRIRGLTGAEVARVKDSVARAKDLDGLVQKLASANAKDKIGAVLEAFGLGADGESDDYVRRLTLLELGAATVKPAGAGGTSGALTAGVGMGVAGLNSRLRLK